jgi:hypothetical protein
VNIFEEGPDDFAPNMNLSEVEVRDFTIELLSENGTPVRTVHEYFTLSAAESRALRGHLTRSGVLTFNENFGDYNQIRVFNHKSFDNARGGTAIELMGPTQDPNVWECRIKIPIQDTWFSKIEWIKDSFYEGNVYLEDRPADWQVPDWVTKSLNSSGTQSEEDEEVPVKKGRKKAPEQVFDYAARNKFVASRSMYGGEPGTYLVRITPNVERAFVFTGPQTRGMPDEAM